MQWVKISFFNLSSPHQNPHNSVHCRIIQPLQFSLFPQSFLASLPASSTLVYIWPAPRDVLISSCSKDWSKCYHRTYGLPGFPHIPSDISDKCCSSAKKFLFEIPPPFIGWGKSSNLALLLPVFICNLVLFVFAWIYTQKRPTNHSRERSKQPQFFTAA